MTTATPAILETSQIFNAIQDCVAIIGKDFNVLSINTAYLRLLRTDETGVIGKKCYDVLNGSLCHSRKCPLTQVSQRQTVVEFETEKLLGDATRVPLILTATPLTSTDGSFMGVIESFNDITDFKLSKRKLERVLDEIISAFAMTVECRDPYTAGHQERVAKLAEKISRKMGLSEDQIKAIWMASSIHDIGKIYVPSAFLNKPGKLSPIEFEVIKTHSDVGFCILKEIEFQWPIAEMVRQHHERMDGSGYPMGLKEEEILLGSRILAVADVVEAISSHRPYRPTIGKTEALREISEYKGIRYDANVVNACLQVAHER
jgi:putative nucleotidyltransferase with HDIG domain/PAS domain S-box-containing protein